MHKELAKIRSTMLGREDHGILTCMLDCQFTGSGASGTYRGVGGMAFGTLESAKRNDKDYAARATAYGMEFINRVLKAANVDKWENLPNKYIYVLTEDDSWSSKVVGIEGLPMEGGYTFMFNDLIKELNLNLE